MDADYTCVQLVLTCVELPTAAMCVKPQRVHDDDGGGDGGAASCAPGCIQPACGDPYQSGTPCRDGPDHLRDGEVVPGAARLAGDDDFLLTWQPPKRLELPITVASALVRSIRVAAGRTVTVWTGTSHALLAS